MRHALSDKGEIRTMTNGPLELEDLPGVGPTTAEKLREAGFVTVESIATASPADLAETAEIGESTAKKMIKAARELADIGGFRTGKDVFEQRKGVRKLKTRVPELDDPARRRIRDTGDHRDVWRVRFGKEPDRPPDGGECPAPRGRRRAVTAAPSTSIPRTPSARSVSSRWSTALAYDADPSGVPGEYPRGTGPYLGPPDVLMLDTARERAAELQESPTCRSGSLSSIRSPRTSVPSMPARGTLAARQQKLNRHMHDLFKLADENNAVGLVTNQVMSNPAVFFGDPTKPIGGNIVGHTATFRHLSAEEQGGQAYRPARRQPEPARRARRLSWWRRRD